MTPRQQRLHLLLWSVLLPLLIAGICAGVVLRPPAPIAEASTP